MTETLEHNKRKRRVREPRKKRQKGRTQMKVKKEGRFIDVVGRGGSWWLVRVDEGPVVVPNGVVSII